MDVTRRTGEYPVPAVWGKKSSITSAQAGLGNGGRSGTKPVDCLNRAEALMVVDGSSGREAQAIFFRTG